MTAAAKLSGLIDPSTGKVLDASAPSGSVIQVVQVVKSDTFSTTVQDTTFVDITGLSASITPTSVTSTILVMANIGKCSCATSGRIVNFRLDRNGTLIALGDTASNRVRISFSGYAGGYDSAGRGGQSASLSFIDSPASTSSLTYKIQMSGHNGEATVINMSGENLDTNDAPHSRSVSSLILMEIAG
jgi:predicted aconitase with swiveling domain